MWNPDLLYYFGTLRQQELIEVGQQCGSARDAAPRCQRRPVTLLLLLFRAWSLRSTMNQMNNPARFQPKPPGIPISDGRQSDN